jgi:hypothetical protein
MSGYMFAIAQFLYGWLVVYAGFMIGLVMVWVIFRRIES